MFNKNINSSPINTTEFIGELSEEDIVTSFGNKITGKYAYISDYGYIFNFNTILCTSQTYGNFLTNRNFDDMATIDIIKYDNPLSNGGIIQRRKATENIINLELNIISNNIINLEKEIRLIKTVFNGTGKLYKKEFDRELTLNVILADNIRVGEKKLSGTTINISFISVSPFWISTTPTCINYEDLSGNFTGTLLIGDSDEVVPLQIIIQIKAKTGTINTLFLNINSYIIEINKTINIGDIIIFDGKTLLINGVKTFYKGSSYDFPINTPSNILLSYSGGGSLTNYNLYILYDKIAL